MNKTVAPLVRLGAAWPRGVAAPSTGWAEPLSRVSFPSGAEVVVRTWGDAVPGGYNGGFSAHDAVTGALMGSLEYQSATNDRTVLIAMVEVATAYRGAGIADVLLMRLVCEFPGRRIDPGMMTPDGLRWWARVKGAIAPVRQQARIPVDSKRRACDAVRHGDDLGTHLNAASGGDDEQDRMPLQTRLG